MMRLYQRMIVLILTMDPHCCLYARVHHPFHNAGADCNDAHTLLDANRYTTYAHRTACYTHKRTTNQGFNQWTSDGNNHGEELQYEDTNNRRWYGTYSHLER